MNGFQSSSVIFFQLMTMEQMLTMTLVTQIIDVKLKSNDLSDLMQFRVIEKTLSDPYLQHGSDLNARMFSERTIRAIGPGKILRGDATGTCCRAPENGDYKCILYYAFVVFVCGNVLPVLEFITCEHNVVEISVAVKHFRGFIEAMECLSWPYFKIVILDWSWALIHSILIEWNDTNIYEYLELTCNHVTHGNPYKAFMVRAQNSNELESIFDKMIAVLVTPFEHKASSVREELYKMRFEGFEEIIAKTDDKTIRRN